MTRTVSFQGTQLSASQRRTMAMQQQVRASFLNPTLQTMVDETFAALDQRKEQGVKPERQWFVDREERGTSCVAEWMGY